MKPLFFALASCAFAVFVFTSIANANEKEPAPSKPNAIQKAEDAIERDVREVRDDIIDKVNGQKHVDSNASKPISHEINEAGAD